MTNRAFRQLDLMQLPANLLDDCDSISSHHATDRFGLGRYGEPITCNGHLRAIENMGKILCTGGAFCLSVPMGS
ncbi:DUF268 domain-containing protein [Dyadobacter sp. 32]|uniref:DUF268 domain-containing protein n=1 Tax=Dyadobacter sp. 32 TaxID=538966 RepID=UPI0039C66A39